MNKNKTETIFLEQKTTNMEMCNHTQSLMCRDNTIHTPADVLKYKSRTLIQQSFYFVSFHLLSLLVLLNDLQGLRMRMKRGCISKCFQVKRVFLYIYICLFVVENKWKPYAFYSCFIFFFLYLFIFAGTFGKTAKHKHAACILRKEASQTGFVYTKKRK